MALKVSNSLLMKIQLAQQTFNWFKWIQEKFLFLWQAMPMRMCKRELFQVKAVVYLEQTMWFSLQNITFTSDERFKDYARPDQLFVLNMDQLNAFLEKAPRFALQHESEMNDDCEGRGRQTRICCIL